MTRTTKLLLTAGALALGATTFAGVSLADGGWGGHRGWGGWGGWGGGGQHGGFAEGLFETFDTNHDGKLTQAEIDQVRQDRFAAFDKNGDGMLSLEEYQALWLDAMHRAMVRSFQALDVNGDAEVTQEEFTVRFSHVVDRLDANGDGQVTEDELHQRFQDRMQERMHDHGRERRGGPDGDRG